MHVESELSVRMSGCIMDIELSSLELSVGSAYSAAAV